MRLVVALAWNLDKDQIVWSKVMHGFLREQATWKSMFSLTPRYYRRTVGHYKELRWSLQRIAICTISLRSRAIVYLSTMLLKQLRIAICN